MAMLRRGGAPCAGAADCFGNSSCVGGACVCGGGWLGSRCNHSEAALRAAMRPSEESAHLCLSGWRLENASGTPLVFAPCRKASAGHQQWTAEVEEGGGADGGDVRIAVAAAPQMCVTAAPLHMLAAV